MKLLCFLLTITIAICYGCGQSGSNNSLSESLPKVIFTECIPNAIDFELESKTYHHKEVTKSNDTTFISFDFVRDCCLIFEGEWEITDEQVLILSYHLLDTDQMPCECKCNYNLKYIFPNKKYTWKRIRIKEVFKK